MGGYFDSKMEFAFDQEVGCEEKRTIQLKFASYFLGRGRRTNGAPVGTRRVHGGSGKGYV